MTVDVTTPAFPYGLASGDLSHDSVVLWTKVRGPGGAIRWSLMPEDGGSERSGGADAEMATGAVHVEVNDLEPGIRYRYWFECLTG